LPTEASTLVPTLIGVMANEHRSDCLPTRVQDDAARPGAIALACPSCGAQLELTSGARFTTCTYCRTTSRIPEKTLYRSGSEAAKPEPFWVAFEGRSTLRKKLERDPAVPLDAADTATDLKVQTAPKRKRMPPAELVLVVLLPLAFVLAVGLVDLLLFGGLELDIPL
jgi:LSD1 subclass zinc finger protein